ncbi:MAG: hypothetical protein PHS79_01110 [Patescibacteria group bacterium]|nr:hypothetical protein [Patescibacteria group bacterium]
MSTAENCLVIFDPEMELLGEILLQDGKCSQINLNQNGELLLGPHVSDWQTHGLEKINIQHSRFNESEGDVLYAENQQLRSEGFMKALTDWLLEHGFSHLVLPSGAMSAFSEIQRMSVSAQKKYELALMLRDLPIEQLAAGQGQ